MSDAETQTQETQTQEAQASQENQSQGQEQQPQQQTTPPDLSEQIQALAAEVAQLRSPSTQQPRGVEDLLSGFEPEPQPQEPDPYGQGFGAPQGVQPPAPQQQQGNELDPAQAEALFQQAIQERVQDAVYPYLEAVDRELRRQQLNRMTEQFPELKDPEVVAAVRDRLTPIAERYDDPTLLSDPDLVAQVVQAMRAERAAANQVPASEAKDQGASIETGAGATAPQGDEDPVEAFKRDLLNAGGSRDAFT